MFTLQLIGYYSYNLVRSLRLVLDTGIHALGWSRQRAVDYLYVNTAMSLQNCYYEIDRYITKPGGSIYHVSNTKQGKCEKCFK